MAPSAPRALRAPAARWEDLTRRERAELGRALRRLGWSYREIRRLIPVPKGTLSRWCRDIRLNDDQAAAIKVRTGSARGMPRDTQRRRRAEIDAIKAAARDFARARMDDALFVAGTVLYWLKVRRRESSCRSQTATLVRSGSSFGGCAPTTTPALGSYCGCISTRAATTPRRNGSGRAPRD